MAPVEGVASPEGEYSDDEYDEDDLELLVDLHDDLELLDPLPDERSSDAR